MAHDGAHQGPHTAYVGTIIYSNSPSQMEIVLDATVVVDTGGKISHVWSGSRTDDDDTMMAHISQQTKLEPTQVRIVRLHPPWQFLIPSFIDTHVHAPQFSMRGLGQGLHILDWLEQVTFPHEAKFQDLEYARKVYESCVATGLRHGVTTACYFASLHTPASKILADVCLARGQRAFIGKTCMNHEQHNAPYYREELDDALDGTRQIIEYCRAIDPRGEIVRPVVTPRFAISCTTESLRGLGDLGAEYAQLYGPSQGILNQTHFCEAQQEIDATLRQYPKFNCEADLYAAHGLLNNHSVLAHCTLLSDADLAQVEARDCGIAHCPISNVTVGGGFMAAPVRTWLTRGLTKIGLGTDSGGGFSNSIMDVMRTAVIVGNAREMLSNGNETRLSLEEVFYMATLGGARVLGMDDCIGSFAVGKSFDAILVDMGNEIDGVQTMLDGETADMDGVRGVWQKWMMTGDDRNLKHVWVGGVEKK